LNRKVRAGSTPAWATNFLIMVYENVIKEYGPYIGKDGRMRIVLQYSDKSKKTISYPKYIMECYLKRYLNEEETVDHIDGNPLNNEINNLRILSRQEHSINDVLRNKDVVVNCAFCGKTFKIKGSTLHYRNLEKRGKSGYFCSKQCVGKYGKQIQNGEITPIEVERVTPDKYKKHIYK
jgi:hypothetical protein